MKSNLKFLFSIIILTIIGLVMVYSSSSIWAYYKTGNEYYYLIRQAIYLILGYIAFFIGCRLNINYLYKKAKIILFIALLLMIIVLIPGFGIKRGGARSWIGIKDLSFQPFEVMKFALIIFTSRFLSVNPMIMKKNLYFYLYLIFVSLVIGLVLLQPDFGSGMILTITIVLMIFVGGLRLNNIIIGGALATSGITFMIYAAPYRLKRIESFIDPWKDPKGAGFQIIQSLYAISPSSLFGYGLFNSKQKYFYLPEPQNDFIFSIIVEELGLVGGSIILLLFLYIIITGYRLAYLIKDFFKAYMVFGFTTLLFVQVFINIAVVIGLIPVTGVTLPLISYGGSSLIITLFMLGIIYKIIKEEKTYNEVI